ncbi:MAG TPA: hypothetical protein VJU13_11545 [Candidatus Nitrosocosmicus sp.]|nr:hypothetical protein [Candidatus Nitrosocosmicus sp.]
MIVIPNQKKNQQVNTGSSLCSNCKKAYNIDESRYDVYTHGFVCPKCGR